ncbi:MAG: hypothetical protein ACKOCM_08865 [Cyanobacteriota bacterium]
MAISREVPLAIATITGPVTGAACTLLLTLLAGALPLPARAQRVIPKLETLCPLGYVDTFNGKCSTLGLMDYTVAPTQGRPCPDGWMNIGGGYCRRK